MPSKNRSQPKVVDDGLVDLDAAKLDRACVAAGMSLRDLATQSDVAWNTLRKLAAGEGVFPRVAHKVAVTLKRDVLSMLAERDPRYEPPLAQLASADWEWELDDYLDPGRRASNGLHYFVCRMRHRHMAGRLGRGKFYALSGLSERERNEKRLHLLRHLEVCSRVRSSPFVAETYLVTPVGQDVGWWIVGLKGRRSPNNSMRGHGQRSNCRVWRQNCCGVSMGCIVRESCFANWLRAVC